jgi:hypothetical protein
MHRKTLVFLFLSTVLIWFSSPQLLAQPVDYNPIPKDPNGSLSDWGDGDPLDIFNYTHLYENEAQWIENAEGGAGGKVEPGDPTDPPLKETLVIPQGRPMGNGYNLCSALVSFDPTHEGGTYWVSWDLPGETNPLVSDSFFNKWVETSQGLVWYPVPFDADSNENKDTVDDPVSGFGSIVAQGLVEEDEEEFYRLFLYVGGDETQAPNITLFRGNRNSMPEVDDFTYTGPGYYIFIEFYAYKKIGQDYEWTAFIPKQFLKDTSADLDLKALGLVSHSDPATQVKPLYDIEVEVNGILSEIWPLIDPAAVGYDPDEMGIFDNFHAFAEFRADTDGDESAEEKIEVGINVPRLPMIVEVDKKVFCGDCTGEKIQSYAPSGDDWVFALAGSDILFEINITIPRDHPDNVANGMGYVYGKDVIDVINNNIDPFSLELCSNLIELDGVTGIIDVDGFNINDDEWVIVENGTTEPYLFYPSDPDLVDDIQIKIPFKVTVGDPYTQKNITQDILNTVTVWGNNGLTNGPEDSDDAYVNILVPEITCDKFLEVYDDDDVLVASGTFVDVPFDSKYPLTAKYILTVENTGETEVDFDTNALEDECLCVIPDLAGTPFCNGNTNPAQTVGIGGSMVVEVEWVIETFNEYIEATNLQLLNGNCDDGTHIWNTFSAIGTVVVDGELGRVPYFVCNDGQDVDVECDSNVVTLTIDIPPAEIEVQKLVSCDDVTFTDNLAYALPGAEVYFRLILTNPAGALVDHEHTWFTDDLVGEATYANDFKITAGYSINPGAFNPNGTIFEVIPPLEIGQSVVMTFRAVTNENWNQQNTGPEITNTLNGAADGPDIGNEVDDQDSDFAEVDILVPEASCSKVVKVTTQDGVYGPAQSIPNIPRTDEYPWNVEWTITVSNDGETFLNLDLTDPLIENWTGNDCSLPAALNIAPGANEIIVCTEVIADYDENKVLDTQDVDGFDEFVHNVATGENVQVDEDPAGGDPVCYLFNGQPVDAYDLDDFSCDSQYEAPPPCGEIVIDEKLVSCFENTGYADSVEAVPGAWVYYRFTVRNPSATVDLEHVYARDQVSGEYVNFMAIDPPNFQINLPYPGFDLGPLNAGQTKTVKFKVMVDPNYDISGPPVEITNTLTVYADGPDLDDDPDPTAECPDAEATVTNGAVNAVVPDLQVEKVVLVQANDGQFYPENGIPDTSVSLPDGIAYPIQCFYTITVTNTGEVDLPSVDVTDPTLESPPGGIDVVCVPPSPWTFAIDIGNQQVIDCTVTLDNFAEAELLAANDHLPSIEDSIDNQASAEQLSFQPDEVCGPTQDLPADSEIVRINLLPPPPDMVPALDWAGFMLLILALSGLIVWRSIRQS